MARLSAISAAVRISAAVSVWLAAETVLVELPLQPPMMAVVPHRDRTWLRRTGTRGDRQG